MQRIMITFTLEVSPNSVVLEKSCVYSKIVFTMIILPLLLKEKTWFCPPLASTKSPSVDLYIVLVTSDEWDQSTVLFISNILYGLSNEGNFGHVE